MIARRIIEIVLANIVTALLTLLHTIGIVYWEAGAPSTVW